MLMTREQPLPLPTVGRPPAEWAADVRQGLAFYALSTLVVLAGVVVGRAALEPAGFVDLSAASWTDAVGRRYDGDWYGTIARDGYGFDPDRQSSVAFFPLYPLLAAGVMRATGLGESAALLVVAHVNLAAAFVVLVRYCRARRAATPTPPTAYVLAAFALWPAAFHARMAYSESTFVLVCLLVGYALARRWPLWVAAVGCGLATATRPVGLALVPLVIGAAYQQSATWSAFARRAAWLVPVCVSGLVAYAAYQAVVFGTPTAFAQTQTHWVVDRPLPWPDKLAALATLEPVWAAFDPDTDVYWRSQAWGLPLALSPAAFDRGFGLLAVIAVAVGGRKRLLTPGETVLSGLLLAIPYLTKGQEMGLFSLARFAAAAFPIYLVSAAALARLSRVAAGLVIGFGALLLACYTALFVAGYPFL